MRTIGSQVLSQYRALRLGRRCFFGKVSGMRLEALGLLFDFLQFLPQLFDLRILFQFQARCPVLRCFKLVLEFPQLVGVLFLARFGRILSFSQFHIHRLQFGIMLSLKLFKFCNSFSSRIISSCSDAINCFYASF